VSKSLKRQLEVKPSPPLRSRPSTNAVEKCLFFFSSYNCCFVRVENRTASPRGSFFGGNREKIGCTADGRRTFLWCLIFIFSQHYQPRTFRTVLRKRRTTVKRRVRGTTLYDGRRFSTRHEASKTRRKFSDARVHTRAVP